MPRYIDADNIDYTVTMVGRDEYAGNRAVAFESDIDAMPTADVVPRAEVAREIDDLRRHILLNENISIKCKRENGEQNEEYWKGKVSALRQIRAYIDSDLKNKYTE